MATAGKKRLVFLAIAAVLGLGAAWFLWLADPAGVAADDVLERYCIDVQMKRPGWGHRLFSSVRSWLGL